MMTGILVAAALIGSVEEFETGRQEAMLLAAFQSTQMGLGEIGTLRQKVFRGIVPMSLGESSIRTDGPSSNWNSFAVHYDWDVPSRPDAVSIATSIRRTEIGYRLVSVTSSTAHAESLKWIEGSEWRYPTPTDVLPTIEGFASEMFTAVPGTMMEIRDRTSTNHWSATFRVSSTWRGYPDPAGVDISLDLRTGLISSIMFEGQFPNVNGLAPGELLSEAEIKERADAEMLRKFYGPLAQTAVGKALVTIKNPVSGSVEYWPINQFLYEELTEDGSAIKLRGKKWYGSVNAFSGETQVSLMVGEAGGGNQRPFDLSGFALDFEQGILKVLGEKFRPVSVEAPLTREFRFSEIGWYVQGNVLLPLQIDTDRRLAMVSFKGEKHYFRY
ncbi:MAG: hypothetical protein KF812_06885 [Fimbriimonadaceae bacterium]|nr:hypothetical protein [Fimbriimonadaceae bacterium]